VARGNKYHGSTQVLIYLSLITIVDNCYFDLIIANGHVWACGFWGAEAFFPPLKGKIHIDLAPVCSI
jgi:hypothetical protein